MILSLLIGWLAGALANWATDVLPQGRATTPDGLPGSTPWRYLLFGWNKYRLPDRAFPWRMPLLGLGTIALFALVWLRSSGDPLRLVILWLYTWFLLTVLVIDLEHRRVLNVMLAPAAVVALIASLLPGGPGLVNAVLGMGAGFGLFLGLAILSRGSLGMGDVKLAGVIGLMVGYPDVLRALIVGILLGGVSALLLLAARRVGRKSYIAYAPYLAVGALAVLLGLLTI